MLANNAYGNVPGRPMECLSLMIELKKERTTNNFGENAYRTGLKIGGGIDQDYSKAPFNYPDSGIYVTGVESGSPADRAGLRQHDKILEVNGIDYTMVTHDKAVKYIKKDAILHILIARPDVGLSTN